MASKYDWDFIRPLDQSANILAMGQGNQQINAGLASMQQSIGGLADAFKQRNTDEVLNALYQAQTSAQLPDALQAVQALQQQYGRGYDQTAVRNAIDTRGSTLGARDLQAINLQQAQAAQSAIPALNQFAIDQAKARGVDTSAMQALAGLGIDASSQLNQYATNALADTRDKRDFDYRKGVDDRNFNYRQTRDVIGDQQWEAGNTRANLTTASDIAKNYVTPAQMGYSVDANGNITTTSTGGVRYSDALPALMGSLFNAESGGVHRQSNGQLTRSPKGALGIAQIMPATAAKPGYGMKPINLQTSTPQEQQQWATDYITRIGKAHNFTTEQAVAAYNAGPGAVQEAIKEGGNAWLSKLPKETQKYVPKVMGGANQSTTAQAMGAIIPQDTMSKVTSSYQDSIAKLNADLNAQTSKDQIKGSIASTGKNVDTWVAGKKEGSWFGNSSNPVITKAGDIGKMAREDKAFNNLPEDAQIKVLEGAYGYLRNSGTFERVPNQQLRDLIHRESANYKQSRIDQFNLAKKDVAEKAYQDMVQAFQASGSRPPSRESVMQLLDPQAKPTQTSTPAKQTQAPKPATPKPVEARQGTPALLSNTPNKRARAIQQGTERATNVANMPTKDEMSTMRARAMAQANTTKQKEEAKKAFDKLEEEKRKKKLSPQTKQLLNQFGGGILK